jgi:hypothetical protein
MILMRSSHYREKDLKILANDTLDPSEFRLSFDDGWKLFLQVKGIDGPSTYDYHVKFSADELALFIETALIRASQDGAIHAHAIALGSFIREVLNVKNNPADT